jgi:hypothetical protein
MGQQTFSDTKSHGRLATTIPKLCLESHRWQSGEPGADGETDENICNNLGLEPDELLRLKHVTGFSKLFENAEYNKAWTTPEQIKEQRKYDQSQNPKTSA